MRGEEGRKKIVIYFQSPTNFQKKKTMPSY